MVRKIPIELENPFDMIYVKTLPTISNIFKSVNFTPNMITTLSFVCGLIALIFLDNNYFTYACVFLLLDNYFDALDGFYARRYNMVTDFGSWYDHFTDSWFFILLFITLYKKYKNRPKLVTWSILGGLLAGLFMHFGCQELFYGQGNSSALSILSNICPTTDLLYLTKYVGMGTVLVYIIFMIYNLEYNII